MTVAECVEELKKAQAATVAARLELMAMEEKIPTLKQALTHAVAKENEWELRLAHAVRVEGGIPEYSIVTRTHVMPTALPKPE